MEAKGVNQKTLAGQVGASPAAVSGWRSGRKTPSAKSLKALAAALDVSAAWLQYGDGDAPKRDARAERTAYRRDLEWYWRGAPPDRGRQLGNPAGFAFDVDIPTLARETGQNSLD